MNNLEDIKAEYIKMKEAAILDIDSMSKLKRKKIYGRIVPGYIDKSSKGYYYLQISLRTEDMIKWDYEYFVNVWKEKKNGNITPFEAIYGMYKPYFFEFIAPATKEEYEKCKACKNIDKWFPVSLYNSNNSDCPRKNDKNTDLILIGTVVFSASPVIQRKKYLTINFTDEIGPQDQISELENIFKSQMQSMSNNGAISGLEQYVENYKSFDFHIYNVGQGNFVNMNFNHKDSILFDAGFTIFKKPQTNVIEANISKFKDLEPKAIILSHWDLDHILGIAYVGKGYDDTREHICDKDILWIVPDMRKILKSVSQSARLLLLYLLRNGRNVYLADNSGKEGGIVFASTDNRFEIWQGSGKAGKFNRNNNIGFIVKINDTNGKIFFPGDCEYSKMPEQCHDIYKYMMVSHHGAEQIIPDKFEFKPDGGVCICSYGNNRYGHPKKRTKQRLEKLRFCIKNTPDVEEYIISRNKCGKYSFKSVPPERENKDTNID